MVGGFDFGKNKFNHVTQAWRQPGSSFKPFIYSAALEKGFTPATVVNDAPLFFDAGATGSQPWEPKNYDGKFDGPMSLQHGAGQVEEHGVDPRAAGHRPDFAQDWITRFGFDAEQAPGLPDDGAGRRLGDAAADGHRLQRVRQRRLPQPVLITRITDSKGRAAAKPAAGRWTSRLRTIDARNAFVMTRCCRRSRARGTAARAQGTLKRPTSTARPAPPTTRWTPGSPATSPRGGGGVDRLRHAAQAGRPRDRRRPGLPVWIDFMQHALKGVPVQEPSRPRAWCSQGGEWVYEEFAGAGVASVGLDDKWCPSRPPPKSASSILDLFKR
jgi:penicillin-binding protein 1A